jgi:hypothetical protein
MDSHLASFGQSIADAEMLVKLADSGLKRSDGRSAWDD